MNEYIQWASIILSLIIFVQKLSRAIKRNEWDGWIIGELLAWLFAAIILILV